MRVIFDDVIVVNNSPTHKSHNTTKALPPFYQARIIIRTRHTRNAIWLDRTYAMPE